MKTNLNIILVLTLITGACSSQSLLSEGMDDLYYTPGEEKSDDLVGETTEGKVPEVPAVEDIEDKQLAYQEYNVSPLDTIWFDNYLIVGRDTLTYEEVYPKFAFEEYGVTPFDTIWFDDFLIVGADTMDYQQVYNTGRKFSMRIYSPGPEIYWSKRYQGLLLAGVTPFDFRLQTGISPFDFQLRAGIVPFFSGLQTGGYGISWNYSAPLISPDQSWVEVVTDDSRNTERPNYTYYMGLPPQVSERDQAPPAMRNDRERGVVFHISILSAILAFLAL